MPTFRRNDVGISIRQWEQTVQLRLASDSRPRTPAQSKRFLMGNDPGWQRRSDDWVKMLDQSNVRKKKRLAEKKRASAILVEQKTRHHVRP